MKKTSLLGILGVLLILTTSILIYNLSATGNVIEDRCEGDNKVVLYDFYGQGCPHCAKLSIFLDEIQEKCDIEVKKYEIYFNQENRELLESFSEAYNIEIQGVPTVFIDSNVIVGFNNNIEEQLKEEIYRCKTEECIDPSEKLGDGGEIVEITGSSSPAEEPGKTELKKKLTIPAVIAAAAIDAINPCAFAVLIILLATILVSKSRKKALLAGLAFSLAIFISYFLMGIGLYSAIQVTGISHTFFIIVAILAIIIGLFNLKDYLWYGKWFRMEVPLSWRPKMKLLIKGVTSVPGAFIVGILVSLFLLPCTSGPYIVILGLLANIATRNYALILLVLYNLIFILPMVIITLSIYFGITTVEKAEEWRTRKLKVLHLIAGIILLLLGIAMLISVIFGWI